MLEIITFIAMIIVSLYGTVVAWVISMMLIGFSGKTSDKFFSLGLFAIAGALWYWTFTLAPFEIIFQGTL